MAFRKIKDYRFRINFQCSDNLWDKILEEQENLRLRTKNDVIEKMIKQYFKNLENEKPEKQIL